MKFQRAEISVLAIILASAVSASAATTISGSDFNNSSLVASYNGTYVASPLGHMHLEYANPDVDAVVGAIGPFGPLSQASMSFTYANQIGGGGNEPFAALGVSDNGLWDGSGHEFLIIAVSGQQVTGSTPIHVWDVNNGVNYAPIAWGSTLSSILGDTANGVAFGNMQVLRAYAYIGDWPGITSGSVDIYSISIPAVPEPATCIAGALLLVPLGLGTVRMFRKSRAS